MNDRRNLGLYIVKSDNVFPSRFTYVSCLMFSSCNISLRLFNAGCLTRRLVIAAVPLTLLRNEQQNLHETSSSIASLLRDTAFEAQPIGLPDGGVFMVPLEK